MYSFINDKFDSRQWFTDQIVFFNTTQNGKLALKCKSSEKIDLKTIELKYLNNNKETKHDSPIYVENTKFNVKETIYHEFKNYKVFNKATGNLYT